MTRKSESRIVLTATIREFFQEVVGAAIRNQRVHTHQMAVAYIAEILSSFARAEALYNRDDGLAERPLTFLLGEAMEAPPDERIGLLKRMGDFCLYVSGFFSDSLNRKLVDVDYYIGMGEGAYANVSGLLRVRTGADEFADLYGELAVKFARFVDVLAEVSEQSAYASNQGTLRLYEKWLRTSSDRIARELRERGVLPIEDAKTKLLQ